LDPKVLGAQTPNRGLDLEALARVAFRNVWIVAKLKSPNPLLFLQGHDMQDPYITNI
jgi:hypothetical protein